MRIILLTQFFPPLIGGIERYVLNLGKSLVERGHQVAVVTLWHSTLPEQEVRDGMTIYRIRGTMQRISRLFTTDRQHSPPFPDPEVTLALWKIIQKEKPDIVHGHDWMVRSFLPLKKWSKARLIRTLHDYELSCAQMRFMYMDRQLCEGPSFSRCSVCANHHYGTVKGTVTLYANWGISRLERNLVDVFVPVSRAVAAANQLVESQSVQIVPNFIPENLDEEAEHAQYHEKLPPSEFILQAGDLVPDKGIFVLLEAYKRLKSPIPLVLIGRRSPLSPSLQELPPGVILIESLPHPLVMSAWKHCLFGIVASTWLDPSPTVTLEAMAMGRPVIGSKIGGIVDQIIDGETGLFVPPGDVDALTKAMEKLIADRELTTKMGLAAKRRAIEFQAKSVVRRIEEIYQSL